MVTRLRGVLVLFVALAVFLTACADPAEPPRAGLSAAEPTKVQLAGADDRPVYEVKPGMLRVVLIEPGSLEASRGQDVYNQVEGQTAILSIVPEGTKVTKGQVVCELDWSSLSDQLTNQVVAVKGAEAAYRNASIAREVAEIGLREYQEGIYPQQLFSLRGESVVAHLAIQKAEERQDRIVRARKRLDDLLGAKGGDRTAAEIVADLDIDDRLEDVTRTLARENTAFAQANSKRDVLEKFTGVKRTKDLKGEVEKARSDELAKQRAWELEKAKDAKLRSQINACKIVAPDDGLVFYADDPNRLSGLTQPKIEEGAIVRERQKIFSLPDLSAPLRVNTKVRETMVARITPGQRVRVKVHAFPEEALSGVVEAVAPLADPTTFFQFDLKVYSATVRIERSLPGLRPGMSAQVEMPLTDLDDVLSIPLEAALELKGKDYVYLVTPNGPAKREVKLGLFNDTMIEVKEGLQEGDKVALNPISLMSDAELREAFAVSKEAKVGDTSPAAVKAGRAVPGSFPSPQKLRNLAPEDREKLIKSASDEERKAILKKAGFTDAELQAIEQIRKRNAPGSGLGRSRRGEGPPP